MSAPAGATRAMRPLGERRVLQGPPGAIEVQIDAPPGDAQGFAFVGHPHPLFGGTLENKVVATLARAYAALGWIAVRPNFRGVGASEGEHDEGRGETQDFLFLIEALPRTPPWSSLVSGAPRIALAGFSFGSFVAASAAAELAGRGAAAHSLVLIGAAAGKWAMPPVEPSTLVIHGELDTTIPLAEVLAWARPLELAVTVIPGADHFFHRKLTLVKRLVMQNLVGAERLGEEPRRADADG